MLFDYDFVDPFFEKLTVRAVASHTLEGSLMGCTSP